jgi:colicin import membrane protein
VTAFNGYPFSVILAVLLHGLILGSLLILQRAQSEVLDITIRPQAVKAILVEENPQARNERTQQQAAQQRQRDEARQEQARQEQARQEQARQEQARQEQARQEQARQEEARQAAVRQQQERDRERQQQEQEQQRVEEQQRRAEEQRRQDDARRQEEQRQQQIAEQQRQAEQARLDADNRQRAETEAEMVMAYTSVIHDLVQRNWSRPPSARNNMTAVLRIRLMPTGDVVDVEIVRSSGDFAFDRAAENAVRAVGRFSELQGMPPRMFERSFRSLLLTFRPEDLLN